ncbi:MAG: prolipoprotein diacylglyceryl transferase [Candidatus Omnitrophica bacterium]|nr:prolipoprotein diacylglyceryl transferase [Candidatus Omnitrophota bacterium]
MHPVLFVLGPLTIYSFGFMLAIAVMVCSYLMARDAKRLNVPPETVYDFAFWTAFSGIIGARLFYVALNWGFFMQSPIEIIQIQNGGLAWQGGLIAGIPTAVIYLRRKNLPLLPFLDLASPYVALGQAIGRIGCFLNGCCHGREVSWGIYVPLYHERLYPTQIYESVGLFAVFLILKKISARPHFNGEVMIVYLLLAAVLRFSVQFFRYDYDPVFMGLGIFQWICVGIFIAAILLLQSIKSKKIS